MNKEIIIKLLRIFYLIQKLVLHDTFMCCALGYLTTIIDHFSHIAAFIVGLILCTGFMFQGSRRRKDKFTIVLAINVILYCFIVDMIVYHFQPWLAISYIITYPIGLLLGVLQSKIKIYE